MAKTALCLPCVNRAVTRFYTVRDKVPYEWQSILAGQKLTETLSDQGGDSPCQLERVDVVEKGVSCLLGPCRFDNSTVQPGSSSPPKCLDWKLARCCWISARSTADRTSCKSLTDYCPPRTIGCAVKGGTELRLSEPGSAVPRHVSRTLF